ncbi:MAG: hypothetical protein H0T98_07815 [Euzebyaceae bacterium]|nr:hypothetical protein [Euzebyaceae bacterium]
MSNQRTPEPGTAADAYYAQVRIVLYDTREAVQFSIRERIVGSEGDTALPATAVASMTGRLRDVPPPPDLRAAHDRLIRVADVASEQLSETNHDPDAVPAAIIAERRITELIRLTHAFERARNMTGG